MLYELLHIPVVINIHSHISIGQLSLRTRIACAKKGIQNRLLITCMNSYLDVRKLPLASAFHEQLPALCLDDEGYT